MANLMQTFENCLLQKTTQQNSETLYPNIPWICVAKQCSIKYDHSNFFDSQTQFQDIKKKYITVCTHGGTTCNHFY